MNRVSVPDNQHLRVSRRERFDHQMLAEIRRNDAIDLADAVEPSRRFHQQIDNGATAALGSRRRLSFDDSANERLDLGLA